jgi:hypothetical protein
VNSTDARPGRRAPVGRWRLLAGLLLALEALPALGASVVLGIELARSEVVVVRNAVMLAGMLLAIGLGLLLLARALLHGRSGARSPAITWQVLLVAVGCYVFAAPHRLSGVAVIAVAVLTAVAVLRAVPPTPR